MLGKKLDNGVKWSVQFRILFQLGLGLMIKRANKLSPAMKMLVQKFVPFPAVGETIHFLETLLCP